MPISMSVIHEQRFGLCKYPFELHKNGRCKTPRLAFVFRPQRPLKECDARLRSAGDDRSSFFEFLWHLLAYDEDTVFVLASFQDLARQLDEAGVEYQTPYAIGSVPKFGLSDREMAKIDQSLEMGLTRCSRGAGEREHLFPEVGNCILQEYLEQRGPKVAAPGRIAYAVLALTDFFEGSSVADLTPHTVGRYVETRRRSIGTVRRELGVLRAAVNYAHRSGRLTRSIAVELPDRPPPRDRWLTRQEAARLIRGAPPQARLYLPLFILLGLYSGRRKEAILSLRWPQVDLSAQTIDFEISGRRRTNKRRGIVRIPPRLLPHLQRAWRRGSELGYVLHVNGKRIGDIKQGFAAACQRAGLQGVSPHTLRHTAATWLMQTATDPWEASGFLSMSLETLHRVYAHRHPDFPATCR